MAARGSILKQEIIQKILDTFPDSFLYNDGKEIRINGMEEGVPLQIKVTLTAAKTAVEINKTNFSQNDEEDSNPVVISEKIPQEPSSEEKERLAMLLNKLGL